MSTASLSDTKLVLLSLGCSVTWLAGVMQIAGAGYQMPQIAKDLHVQQIAEQTWVSPSKISRLVEHSGELVIAWRPES